MIDNNLKNKLEKIFVTSHLMSENRIKRQLNKFEKCGDYTINFINNLNPKLVLDLGCGDNQYKRFIKNLVGIDLFGEQADIIQDIGILPYDNNTVDAIICFGSINFGDESLIQVQLQEVYRVLKNGGFVIFRGNMKDHNDDQNLYFGWSKEKVKFFSDYFNLEIIEGPDKITRTYPDGTLNTHWKDLRMSQINQPERTPYRLFWIWKKNE